MVQISLIKNKLRSTELYELKQRCLFCCEEKIPLTVNMYPKYVTISNLQIVDLYCGANEWRKPNLKNNPSEVTYGYSSIPSTA